MKIVKNQILLPVLLLLTLRQLAIAIPGDLDNDGLRDGVETNTGIYVSPSNTGTNPSVADSDGDSVPDGLEVNHGTNPDDPASKRARPNIILINCDDLGYGDLGCFWQNQKTGNKFATPGIDTMAAQGMKLTHHYVGAPICASSRASLLQGRHQGHADIRDKDFDKPLPNNHSIASVLRGAGYKTVHVGKAGLAGAGEINLPAHPLVRGFDRFFGYYSHFKAQEHYPQNGTSSAKACIFDDYQKITRAYVDLYTTDAFTGFAKKTIIEETQTRPERPFFIYIAYDAPHFYNAIPPTPTYPAGFGLTGGIQWTGAPSYVNTATNDPAKINNIANQHPSVNPGWPQSAREHVSMIRRIDDSVADLLQTLRDLNIDQNTLVVFTSDNGPDDFQIDPTFFQGYANFEGKKTDMWEGGIRVPTVAWWPGTIPATNNPANIATSTRPSGNWDWLATFSEFAAVPAPSYTDGVSLAPTLTGVGTQKDKGYLYFEFNYSDLTRAYFPIHGLSPMQQMQNVRIGNFMGVRRSIASASDNFMIFDVSTDDKERFNLAASKPDLQARMKEIAISARRPGGGVSRPYDTTRIPAVSPGAVTNGLKYKCYEGYWSWIPEFRNLTPVTSGVTALPSPSVRSRNDDVGVAYTGYISIPTAGAYTFSTNSDAATSLWIHDGHVIDNDFNFASSNTSTPVYLEPGLHPIRLYYRHQGGAASLVLSYSGPDIVMQPVPAASFFTEGPAPVIQLQPDTLVTRKSTPASVNVLTNDTSNYPLSVSSVGAVVSGSVSLTAGSISYSPGSGFIGTDIFSYTAMGGSAAASSLVTADVLFDDETWIPFEEGTGLTTKMVSPSGIGSANLVNVPTDGSAWIDGKFRKGLKFDGVDDLVDLPGTAFPIGGAPRTFSCWVRATNETTNMLTTLFSYGNAEPGKLFLVRLNNTPGTSGNQPIRLEVFNGTVIGTKTINDGQWHHIAVVVSDQNKDSVTNVNETLLYVDGSPDPIQYSSSMAINTISNFLPCLGGSHHASNYFYKGDIDDVRIFRSALSGGDIAALSESVPDRAIVITDPAADNDGDGATNNQETVAGTNPNDATSVFKITSFQSNTQGLTLRWSAVAGKSYIVQKSTDLSDWTIVPGISPYLSATDNPDATLTIPTSSQTARFFRLGVK